MSKKAEGFSLRFVLINTGNISRKVLSKVLRSFVKNFERLQEARDREEQLVKQMMEKEGITEELKRQDNMDWTRRMNTLCHDAEEMILTEMIYTKG